MDLSPAAAHRRRLKRRSSRRRARTTRCGGALHSASSDLSDVGADRPIAGMALDKMRRPGTQRMLNTLGLKTSLGRSTRTGSRSSRRVSAHLAIVPFLGQGRIHSNAAPLRQGVVRARRLLLRLLG